MVKDTLKIVSEIFVVALFLLVLSLCLFLAIIATIGTEAIRNTYNLYQEDFWFAVKIYFCFACIVEMIVHEYGHYYFQRKFNVAVTIFRIGIFSLFKRKTKTGTDFILGIPILAAESRALGELEDREKEKNNSQSFYYIRRHPKERLIISLGGIGLTLSVCVVLLASFYIQSEFLNVEIPLYLYIVVYFAVATQISNLIPLKIGKFGTDAWVAIESVRDWVRFKKPSTLS